MTVDVSIHQRRSSWVYKLPIFIIKIFTYITSIACQVVEHKVGPERFVHFAVLHPGPRIIFLSK